MCERMFSGRSESGQNLYSVRKMEEAAQTFTTVSLFCPSVHVDSCASIVLLKSLKDVSIFLLDLRYLMQSSRIF